MPATTSIDMRRESTTKVVDILRKTPPADRLAVLCSLAPNDFPGFEFTREVSRLIRCISYRGMRAWKVQEGVKVEIRYIDMGMLVTFPVVVPSAPGKVHEMELPSENGCKLYVGPGTHDVYITISLSPTYDITRDNAVIREGRELFSLHGKLMAN